MAKKTITAAKVAEDETILPADGAQAAAATSEEAAAATPSGKSGPDGTNTRSESSGDAAGQDRSGDHDPVKPQDEASQTDAIVAEATTGASNPEAEASASGTSSSQGGAAVEPGANAIATAPLTAAQVNEIQSRILGVTIRERREFIVNRQVRHDNRLYGSGDLVTVDQAGHAELAAIRAVSPAWEAGFVVEG